MYTLADLDIISYVHHWWNGSLDANYHFGSISITQLNKVIKLLSYSFGLLAIFEFVHFQEFMRKLRVFATLYLLITYLLKFIFNIPRMSVILIVGSLAFITGQASFSEAYRSLFLNHVEGADRFAQRRMQGHRLLRSLYWLENHPLSDDARKRIIFASFAMLAFMEIFTS